MKRISKLMSFLLCAALAFCLMPAARAESSYALVSGSSTLNIRATPGVDGRWLGRAFEGDWVEILTTESNGWHYCRVVATNQYGYMSGNYLSTYEKSASNGTDYSVAVVNNPVSTQFLNLRQYPSYDAPVLGIYYNGAMCRILNALDGWYYVDIGGTEGYFRSEYIQVTGTTTLTTAEKAQVYTGNSGKLNLRASPSATANVLGQFANGTQVTVLLKGADYWEVNAGGTVGFMDRRYLSSVLSGVVVNPGTSSGGIGTGVNVNGSSSGEIPVTSGYVIVSNPRATSYLNLRSQPSISARVLAQYKNGIRLEVISQGETWCKVYGRASGNIGYVMTKYVKLYGLPNAAMKTVSNGNSYVNLRSAPSKTTGSVFQQVNSGTQVTVLTPGDEWTQVRCGGTVGYMMTCFLR